MAIALEWLEPQTAEVQAEVQVEVIPQDPELRGKGTTEVLHIMWAFQEKAAEVEREVWEAMQYRGVVEMGVLVIPQIYLVLL